MADLSDVIAALRATIGLALYPTQPASGNSVAGIPVLVQSGWPDPASLDKLANDAAPPTSTPRAMVSIYPQPTERNTSRMASDFDEADVPAATIAVSAVGQVITISGTQPNPFFAQNVAVLVNGKPYRVTSHPGDTPSTIAAALQTLIVADVAGTTVAGPAITLPTSARIGALRVGTTGMALREIGRQQRSFQIVIWAVRPSDRDAVAKVVDPALRAITNLLLADKSYGRLSYVGSPYNDFIQKQGLYRRDLVYAVEYSTTQAITAEQIVVTQIDTKPSADGTNPLQTFTLYN